MHKLIEGPGSNIRIALCMPSISYLIGHVRALVGARAAISIYYKRLIDPEIQTSYIGGG
jgi:hypothetical protein